MAATINVYPVPGGGDHVVVGTTEVTGSAVFSNSNGVTFGVSDGTVTASVAAGPAAISAGAASVGGGTVVFSNSNAVSFGVNGSTVTASHAGPRALSAGTTSVAGGTVVLSNSNGVSFGLDGSTITASHNGLTSNTAAPIKTVGFYANMVGPVTYLTGQPLLSASRPLFFPLGGQPFDGQMTLDTLGIHVQGNPTKQDITNSYALSVSVGLYTLANSTQISLLNSASWTTGSNTNENNNMSNRYGGHKVLTIHSSQWSAAPVLTGTNYWLGVLVSTDNIDLELSFRGASVYDSLWRGVLGSNAAAATFSPMAFFGSYSAGTAALPTAVTANQAKTGDGAAIVPMVVGYKGVAY